MTKLSCYLVHAAILLFPSAVLTFNSVKDLAIGLLLLNAVLMLIFTRREWNNLTVEIKWVLFSFCLFALWASYSTFVTGQLEAEGHKRWERYSSFAFSPLLVLLFYRIGGTRDNIVAGAFALGSCVVFLYAVYQYNFPTPGFGGRAWGDTHPNRYGGGAMTLAVVCLSYALFSSYKAHWRVLLLVCAGLGCSAAFYSGTRGSWLVLPFVVSVFVLLHVKKKQQWKKALAWGGGVLLSVLLIAIVFDADKHVKRTYSSITAYQEGDARTSLGLRFEMFKSALLLSKKSPVVGVGVGNYHTSLKELVDATTSYKFNPAIKEFHNPHNEYLLSLAERGGVGLLVFLLVLIIPAYAFYRQYKRYYLASSVAGIGVVVCFSIVGLSIGLFEHTAFVQIYIFSISILLCSRDVVNKAAIFSVPPLKKTD